MDYETAMDHGAMIGRTLAEHLQQPLTDITNKLELIALALEERNRVLHELEVGEIDGEIGNALVDPAAEYSPKSVEHLRAAIHRYAQHERGCEVLRFGGACTCGLKPSWKP